MRYVDFFCAHWQYIAPALVPWLSTWHPRFARWPVFQVVLKHIGGLPALKHVAVEISRVVVAEWGTEPGQVPAAPVTTLPQELAPLAEHLTPSEAAVIAAAVKS